MKKLLGIIALGLLLSLNAKADNIKDFQIEGISLGDSLLDYYSEKYIKNKTKDYGYSNKDFIPVSGIKKNVKTYDVIGVYYKADSPKKVIYALDGVMWFKNSISKCEKEKQKTIDEIAVMFPNAEKKDVGIIIHKEDKSGKSTKNEFRFIFDDDSYVRVTCYDWSKKMKYWDHLRVGFVHPDFRKWLDEVTMN